MYRNNKVIKKEVAVKDPILGILTVQLPVIAFLGYGITNGYWIGSTRYVFEDMCHA
eukprot:COSAG01_NODE_74504_length_211_cov_3.214286_1_plen_55_part_01